MSSDGIAEINGLSLMPFEGGYPEAPANARLALVLIEPRLLEVAGDPTLRSVIDEGLDNYAAVFVAIRRFLREVKANYPNFEGAVLVGSFPDSMLVRRVAWAPGFISPRRLAVWA